MSYAEEVMNEIKNGQVNEPSTETPAMETPVEKPAEETPTQETEKPSEEPVKEPSEEPAGQEQEPEPKQETETKPEPKPDLSTLTKEEKANHAFQRQLAKQKAKYENSIDDLKKSFQTQFDDLKKQMQTRNEEPAKTRNDFDTDDEYIQYLASSKVDSIMAQRDADAAKAAEERAAKERAEAEEAESQRQIADQFNANARQYFGDNYGEFEARVKKGVANGLADVLDGAPAVRDYIFSNPHGPAVLDAMLNSKETFVRIMSQGTNPITSVIECHELARELDANKSKELPPVETVARRMPSLGKPGAGAAPSTAPDMYSDDTSLIDFVRKHR